MGKVQSNNFNVNLAAFTLAQILVIHFTQKSLTQHHFHSMAYSQYTFAPGRSLSSPDVSVSSFHSISSTLAALPPLLPPSQSQRRHEPTRQKLPHTFICTVCWTEQESPPYAFGLEGRIVCANCWRWIHNISICWRCGEVVFRKTDAVSFGWCWWHWNCFSCLICAVCRTTFKQTRPIVPC